MPSYDVAGNICQALVLGERVRRDVGLERVSRHQHGRRIHIPVRVQRRHQQMEHRQCPIHVRHVRRMLCFQPAAGGLEHGARHKHGSVVQVEISLSISISLFLYLSLYLTIT